VREYNTRSGADSMPKKPLFDCETLFPRIAAIIREADGYIAYYEIVE
jgi:hypothetical protein